MCLYPKVAFLVSLAGALVVSVPVLSAQDRPAPGSDLAMQASAEKLAAQEAARMEALVSELPELAGDPDARQTADRIAKRIALIASGNAQSARELLKIGITSRILFSRGGNIAKPGSLPKVWLFGSASGPQRRRDGDAAQGRG